MPGSKPTVVFVLGGPGAGKGTQCKKIVTEYGFVHLSAGDLLRAERKRTNSEVGAMIANYIKEGKIVPVAVTVGLIKTAMERGMEAGHHKYLIDGFPRNADNLDGWNKIMADFADVHFTLFLDCPEKTMETRLLGRDEGRTDDNIESIRKRFHTYQTETRPILDIFQKEGKLRKIDSDRPIEAIFADVDALFAKFKDAPAADAEDEPKPQFDPSGVAKENHQARYKVQVAKFSEVNQEQDMIARHVELVFSELPEQAMNAYIPLPLLARTLCEEVGYEDQDELEDALNMEFEEFLVQMGNVDINKDDPNKVCCRAAVAIPESEWKHQEFTVAIASRADLWQTITLSKHATLQLPVAESYPDGRKTVQNAVYNHIATMMQNINMSANSLSADSRTSLLQTLQGYLDLDAAFEVKVVDPSGQSNISSGKPPSKEEGEASGTASAAAEEEKKE